MDAVSEKRLALVIPILGAKVRILEQRVGVSLRVTQGLRNGAEQDALWSQGRFPLAIVNAKRAAVGWAPITAAENVKPVTNAKPGESWHELGLAIDVVPMDPVPDWNLKHAVWQQIVTEAKALGLTDGISWHDEPHLQITGIFPTDKPNEEALYLFKEGGLQAVWDGAQIAA
jgi:hypothetical protein